MARGFWGIVLDLLASVLTKQKLREAGAGPDALQAAVTTRVELPTLGTSVSADEATTRAALVAYMRSQLGLPYRLGVEVEPGEVADAWDCSELIEAAYRAAGMPLPDGSQYQYDACQPVASARAGDLHFLWSDKWGRIGHVMMDTGDGTVVHAVGGRGVVEDPAAQWTGHPRYRGCRRHVDFARPKEDWA